MKISKAKNEKFLDKMHPKDLDFTQIEHIIEFLESFLTPSRRNKFRFALGYRTRYLTVVLEDIHQAHNAAAVLRSCDCFGIQDIHAIENRNRFLIKSRNSNVSRGAEKWLTLHRYGDSSMRSNKRERTTPYTQICLESLREKGYRIIATTLKENSIKLEQIPLDKPIALMVGTEDSGLSQKAHEMADIAVHLPLHGFTRSFNLSVCTALCLDHLTHRLHASNIPWQLTHSERQSLHWEWIHKTLKSAEKLIKQYPGFNRSDHVLSP